MTACGSVGSSSAGSDSSFGSGCSSGRISCTTGISGSCRVASTSESVPAGFLDFFLDFFFPLPRVESHLLNFFEDRTRKIAMRTAITSPVTMTPSVRVIHVMQNAPQRPPSPPSKAVSMPSRFPIYDRASDAMNAPKRVIIPVLARELCHLPDNSLTDMAKRIMRRARLPMPKSSLTRKCPVLNPRLPAALVAFSMILPPESRLASCFQLKRYDTMDMKTNMAATRKKAPVSLTATAFSSSSQFFQILILRDYFFLFLCLLFFL
ncbi:unknown [Bacteroides sp. CAG:1060]|nr:unknown [Bacteroides sp. CAG:1060]